MKVSSVLLAMILLITSVSLVAQDNLPRLSPKAFVGQTIGYTNVEIQYGSPGVKSREIWGKLVPYGDVWRMGANEATNIKFDKDILVEGRLVPAGIYSLFSVPNKDSWKIILNKVYDQWGAYKYDKKENEIEFSVKPSENNFVERLKFSFEYKTPYKTLVAFEWEKLRIEFEINSKLKE